MSCEGKRRKLDEEDTKADRWLRSFSPFNSHTFSFLSSPTVTMCSNPVSTAEKRTGPDFRRSVVCCSSKFVVDPSNFPVLNSNPGVRHRPPGDWKEHTPIQEQRNVGPRRRHFSTYRDAAECKGTYL